jgi:hypothetical protein
LDQLTEEVVVARRSAVLVVCVGLSCGLTWAGDGGFNGLALGIDLSNTSTVDYGYVRIADNDSLEPQTFTIEAWIHPLGPGVGFDPVFIGKPAEGAAGNYIFSWMMIRLNSTGQIWSWLTNTYGSNGVNFVSDGTVPIGSSAHVAMTFDGTWVRLFIDGVEDTASPIDAGFSDVYYGSEDVLIGAANFTSSFLRRFDGIIDEVRIWDHARTEGEIAGQMNCALDGTEPGLLAYYSFNMGDARDDSGQGHDGLIEGAADYVDFSQDCMIHFDGFDDGTMGWWN